MTAADDEGSQGQAADYDGEGQERAVRRRRQQSGDYGCSKDGGSGRQRRRTTTAMAVDDGGRQRQRTMTACEIRRRTTMGKVRSRLQTTTALSVRDREDDVVFNVLEQNTFLVIR